jgi:hypothetical protein
MTPTQLHTILSFITTAPKPCDCHYHKCSHYQCCPLKIIAAQTIRETPGSKPPPPDEPAPPNGRSHNLK